MLIVVFNCQLHKPYLNIIKSKLSHDTEYTFAGGIFPRPQPNTLVLEVPITVYTLIVQ